MPFFPSRYPIMCAVMNGASDLSLALAVNEAGAMPSLLLKVRDKDNRIMLDTADQALIQYKQQTGHTNVVLSVNHEDILEPGFVTWLDRVRPSHIELLGYEMDFHQCCYDPRWVVMISRIRKFAKIMARCSKIMKPPDWADGLCIKGRESAGFSSQSSVGDITKQQLSDWPHLAIIPYGGVGTAQQVKNYLDMGAAAVACGSVFAASKESCLDIRVKQKIVEATIDDLVTFPETGQRALILGSYESVIKDSSDYNRSRSLREGIRGDGTVGHIYLGESVQYITSIRSVKDIVDDLVHLL